MRRYDPGYVSAKQRIDAGELGRVETFRALSRDTYPPSVKFLRQSGGLFLDMAVFDLFLAPFFVGGGGGVQAWGAGLIYSPVCVGGYFDTAVTLFRFVNGAFGVVETSRRSNWGYDIRTEVAGAEGKVVVEGVQKTPVIFSRNFAGTFDHFENFPDRFAAGYRLELEAFFKALQNGQVPTPGAEDALETLRLAIAAARSWREKRSIKLSEIAA